MSKSYRYLLAACRSSARFSLVRATAVGLTNLVKTDGRVVPSGASDRVRGVDDVHGHVSRLQAEGYSTGVSLSTEMVDLLKRRFMAQGLVEDRTGRKMSYDEACSSQSSAAFRWLNPHLTDEDVAAISKDSNIVRIAEKYLGCTPILHSTQMWLLNPPDKKSSESAEYGWHYDIDDFRFLKLFFYLTDTADVDGQHMLVGRSHKDIRIRRLTNRRMSNDMILSMYHRDDLHKMDGAAGDGFFEDTWLYHKATPPTGKRIMMQIEYCATGILKSIEKRIF